MTSNKRRQAGLKAAETKGAEERSREAKAAAWTREHGKDDSKNPYSMENYKFVTKKTTA
jgi:hypothetical protein